MVSTPPWTTKLTGEWILNRRHLSRGVEDGHDSSREKDQASSIKGRTPYASQGSPDGEGTALFTDPEPTRSIAPRQSSEGEAVPASTKCSNRSER